ncbi:hypothetical protein [Metabacillus litoralis]|uniref:hypothetical protein n=1 Tax=Metabacillus litoralis TaxID=152268 RepID=UPI001CFEBF1E|nr:hypothetical protein [Metabacillus litoralis]
MLLYSLLGISLIAIVVFLFQRNISLKSVPCIDVNTSNVQSQVVVDIRDYNNISKELVSDAIVIPIAYLKRYYHEIPSKNVHVVASTKLEKNIGIRFLQKNGFRVTGYSLSECTCTNKSADIAF